MDESINESMNESMNEITNNRLEDIYKHLDR